MKSSSVGLHNALTWSAFLRIGVFSVVMLLLEILLYRWLVTKRITAGKKGKETLNTDHSAFTAFVKFLKKNSLRITAVILSISLLTFCSAMDVYGFVSTAAADSDFIQDHYADPGDTGLHFPDRKRNLVYIFLESMENTFTDTDAGEQIQECYIPEPPGLPPPWRHRQRESL